MDHTAEPSTPVDTSKGYETRDANMRWVIAFGVGLGAMVVVVQVGLWGLLRGISGEPEKPSPLNPPDVIHNQRVKLNTQERTTLDGDYRWVNQKAGVVALPIDEAMKRIAERGLPATSKSARTSADINSHSGKPAEATAKEKAKGEEKAKALETQPKSDEKAKGAKP